MQKVRPGIILNSQETMLLILSKSVNGNMDLIASYLSLIMGYIKCISFMIFVNKKVTLTSFAE